MSNLPITAKVSKNGELELAGIPVSDLVKEFATPLYVLDEKTVRERCREYKTSFRSNYPNVEIIYACKALCTTAVLKIIFDEGIGADVVSGGELYTALKAGVDPKKIYFHGNNKSAAEIQEGLKAGIGRFVADNIEELKVLDEMAGKMRARAHVLLRINPGIEAHTHEFVRTGQTDSKFGFAKDNVVEIVSLIDKMKNVNFVGLHAHIGSQILETAPFLAEIDVLLELAKAIHDRTGIECEEINMGGKEKANTTELRQIYVIVTSTIKTKIEGSIIISYRIDHLEYSSTSSIFTRRSRKESHI